MARKTWGLVSTSFATVFLPFLLLLGGLGALSSAFSRFDTYSERVRALISAGLLLSTLASSWFRPIDDDPPTDRVRQVLLRPWEILALICLAVLLIAMVRQTLLPAGEL